MSCRSVWIMTDGDQRREGKPGLGRPVVNRRGAPVRSERGRPPRCTWVLTRPTRIRWPPPHQRRQRPHAMARGEANSPNRSNARRVPRSSPPPNSRRTPSGRCWWDGTAFAPPETRVRAGRDRAWSKPRDAVLRSPALLEEDPRHLRPSSASQAPGCGALWSLSWSRSCGRGVVWAGTECSWDGPSSPPRLYAETRQKKRPEAIGNRSQARQLS